jgi:hypothetical protein
MNARIGMRRRRIFISGVGLLLALAIIPAGAAAAPATFTDDDFAGGTVNGTVVDGGALQLAHAVEEFSAGLPATWSSTPWSPEGGAATVADGALAVDGALAGAPGTLDAPRVVRFRATFTADAFQHVGLGTDFGGPPWAMFSTGGGALDVGLYARTAADGQPSTNEPIAGVDPLEPHEYEIRWTADTVTFLVDGDVVSTQAVTLPDGLRFLASDFAPGGGALSVDDVDLGLYGPTGSFTSRIVDVGPGQSAWSTLTTDPADAPGVTVQTRTGDTPVPDGSWSAPEPLGDDGAIESPHGRYLQYVATLASDGTATPALDGVTIAGETDTTAPTAVISGVEVSGRTATVSFSSPDPDVARTECSLDAGPFATCTSAATFGGLAAGAHTIAVRAVDLADNVGSAATRSFTVAAPQPGDGAGGGAGGGGGSGGAPAPAAPAAAGPAAPPAVLAAGSRPADRTAPVIGLTPRSPRLSRAGTAAYRLRCPGTETRCRITVSLRRGSSVIARTTIVLAGGRATTIRLRARGVLRYLWTHPRLRVVAVIGVTDAAGNRAMRRVAVTLRAPAGA